MIIYLARCIVTGKAYVGQTITGLRRRWKRHCSEAKKDAPFFLHRAIRKYGVENFEVSILAEAHTLDELNALERYHIEVQNTLSPRGYNLHTGGQNHDVSEETREKLRQAQLGKKLSPETRAKMSASRMGNQNSKGKKQKTRSFETCEKIRASALARWSKARAVKGH
jgi:group I intron endonuclease